MTKKTVRFADPPTKKWTKYTNFDWEAIYAELRANPGEWAVLAEPGYISTYNSYAQGKISTFNRALGVEMRTTDNDVKAKPRTCTLWARYNPDYDESLTVKQREQIWVQYRKKQREKEKQMDIATVATEGDD
jgi:hypothetical protein